MTGSKEIFHVIRSQFDWLNFTSTYKNLKIQTIIERLTEQEKFTVCGLSIGAKDPNQGWRKVTLGGFGGRHHE